MELTGVEAAAYERVSKDDDGDEKSPEEQHSAHVETCERMGWTLQSLAYRDIGSASIHKRKARGDFGRLVADLEEGRFTAKVLMLWESSRGSRETEEWLHLINLCTKRGVIFWVDVHDRTYDPRKARDRKSLIDDASNSEYETSLMSERIRRTTKSSAAKGLPHGRIPFGYLRRYDEKTRKLIAQEPHPIEAPIVREMYRRVMAGHSLKGIARDLNARELYRRDGGEWVPQNIALMLLREVYVGLRVHDPLRESVIHPMTSDGLVVEGKWEPLVDERTFLAVKRVLRDPKRNRNERPGAAVHFLSGIAVCDVCDEVLRVNRRHGMWRYVCVKNGCVTIDQASLDQLAEDTIVEYLSTDDLYSSLVEDGDSADSELRDVEKELADAERELEDLEAAVERKEMKALFAGRLGAHVEARVEKLKARKEELQTPAELSALIKPGPTARKQWEAAVMSTRRAIARILLVPSARGELGVGQLRVVRVGPGKRVPPVSAEDRTDFFRVERVAG